MSIRDNLEAAKQIAADFGVHIPTDQPAVPTGSDPKSAAIAAIVREAQRIDAAAAETCNRNLDAIRRDLVAAADRAIAADQQGEQRP